MLDRRWIGTAIILTFAAPAGAVTYSTVPASVPAGSPAFTLTINRSFTAGDEGYSQDEMNTFTWKGPTTGSNKVSIGPAQLVSLTQVTIAIPANLLTIAGPVTIEYIADPTDTRETRTILFSITAASVVQITTTFLANGVRNTAYSTMLQAAGGTPPYSWIVINGSLAAGLSLAANGVLSGTPSVSGTFNVSIRVNDSASGTDVRAFTLVITDPSVSCTITPQNAFLGMPHSRLARWHASAEPGPPGCRRGSGRLAGAIGPGHTDRH